MGRSTVSTGRMPPIRALEFSFLTDAELVALVKKGTPEAYQELVNRYHALVRSIAARFLEHDRMALEDACQETFLKALARLGDLRKPSRFRSWLCAIARNQALDTARRRRLVVSWEVEDDDGVLVRWEIADSKANPAEVHDRSEVAGILRDILGAIPDLYRDPITLRFEEELEYREIARQLGKPLGTIKSLIHRGKTLIRKELAKRAWGSDGARVLAS